MTSGVGSPAGPAGRADLAVSAGAGATAPGESKAEESRGTAAKLRNRRTVASLILPERVIAVSLTSTPQCWMSSTSAPYEVRTNQEQLLGDRPEEVDRVGEFDPDRALDRVPHVDLDEDRLGLGEPGGQEVEVEPAPLDALGVELPEPRLGRLGGDRDFSRFRASTIGTPALAR